MGSISQTPPLGPYVPSGSTASSLSSATTTAQNIYQSQYTNYTNAYTNYVNKKDEISNFLSTNGISSAADWDPNDNTLLNQYLALEQELFSLKNSLSMSNSILITRATQYVDALTRQQLFANADTEQKVTNEIQAALALVPADQLSTTLPGFPWFSDAQIAALEQSMSSIDSSEQASAAATLLSAFTNARHQEYLIAQANYTMLLYQMNLVELQYAQFEPNSSVSDSDIQTVNNQITTQSSLINTLLQGRTTYQTILTNARTAYESTYNASTTPLAEVVIAFQNYVTSYTNALQNVANSLTANLEETKTSFETADTAQLSEQEAKDLEIYRASIEPLIHEIEEQNAKLLAAASTQGAAIPTLPESTKNLSISELIGIISKVQLLTLSLIQMLQSSASQITALRGQLSLTNLTILGENIAAFQQAALSLQQADMAFNEQVNAVNTTLYSSFLDTYGTWRSLLTDNLDVMNEILEEINAQIRLENENAQALVDSYNVMRPEIVDAINWERRSNITSLIPVSGSISTISPPHPRPDVTPIPEFEPFTGDELPSIDPANPPSPDNYTIPTEYPVEDTQPADFATHVENLNATITDFLQKIAPYQQYLIQGLQERGFDITITPYPLLLQSTIPIRDYQVEIQSFLSPFISLLSAAIESSSTKSGTESSSQEIAHLKAMLEKILKPVLSEVSTGGTVSGISATSANLFATQSQLGRALYTIVASDIYQTILRASLEQSGIVAGLATAGTPPSTEQTMYGVPLSELLGTSGELSVEDQTKQTLLINLMMQLALLAANADALQANAKTILGSIQELAGLSSDQIQQLIAALISSQQNFLFAASMMAGIFAGLTPGQVLLMLFKNASVGGLNTQAFVSAGFSENDARKLTAFALDNQRLISLLTNSGLSQAAVLSTVASLAASRGIVRISTQSTVYSTLQNEGLTLSSPPTSPDFVSELATQLSTRVSSENQATLRSLLENKAPSPSSPEGALSSLSKTIQDLFAARTREAETTAQVTAAPNLQAFLSPYETIFAALSQDQQSQILASASSFMADATFLSDQQRAAIAIAVRLGDISIQDAMNMLLSYQASIADTQIEALQSKIIANLFIPSEEQRAQMEEDLRKFRQQLGDSRIDTDVFDTIIKTKQTFVETIANNIHQNISDEQTTMKAILAFGETVKHLSNFNAVFLDYIINVGWGIIKSFSLYTISDADKAKNPPISFFG